MKNNNLKNIRWMLVLYDAAVFILVSILMFVFYEGNNKLSYIGIVQQSMLALVCVFAAGWLVMYMDRFGDMEAFSAI